jgi:DNA modification methylase
MIEHRRVGTAQLSTFEKNPRRGNVEAIADSLRRHGQYRAIVVNAGTLTGRPMEVLAGNHTLLAARALGWDTVEAGIIDVDEQAARAIVAADNRVADLGGYDEHALLELLASLDDLSGSGYLQADVDALQAALYPPTIYTDPDDAPDLPVQPMCRAGQLWELGSHRLLVGDATDTAAVQALCAPPLRPDCMWTDPPYGVDYVGKTKDALMIQNDGLGSLPLFDLLQSAFVVAATVCRPGAPVYIAHAETGRVIVESAAQSAGLLIRETLIWAKNTMVLGHSDYHYQHEPILYGFVPGAGRLGRGGAHWFGDNSQTTVFGYDKPTRSAQHPTMKPVALIDAMLANSVRPGGVVLDPFAGSGSTLIAAHGRGARALLVELDPCYADVIVRRFQRHTGITPIVDGRQVSLLEEKLP